MAQAKELAEHLNFTRALGEVTTAYEEIDMMRIRDYKERIVKRRAFIEGLMSVFKDIQDSFEQTHTNQPNQSRAALILITPNKGLAGTIVRQVFDSFWQFKQNHTDSDIIIIGRTGKELFESKNQRQPYHYYPLDANTGPEQWRDLMIEVMSHPAMVIFHGYFENLVTQTIHQIGIKQLSTNSIHPRQEQKKDGGYIFEPDLNRLLRALQAQMIAETLQTSTKEGYLAELGSRISSLEVANGRIEKELIRLTNEYRRAQKDKKLERNLTNIAGIMTQS